MKSIIIFLTFILSTAALAKEAKDYKPEALFSVGDCLADEQKTSAFLEEWETRDLSFARIIKKGSKSWKVKYHIWLGRGYVIKIKTYGFSYAAYAQVKIACPTYVHPILVEAACYSTSPDSIVILRIIRIVEKTKRIYYIHWRADTKKYTEETFFDKPIDYFNEFTLTKVECPK